MTVKELLSRIDSQELTEWMAFYELEPFGTEPEDYRTGIIASTIANVNRDAKRQPKPYRPQDFMPVWTRKAKKEQSEEEMRQVIMMWNRVLGGG